MGKKQPFNLMTLFLDMMMISAFTFGGGFVMIGMMRKKFADERHWVSDDEVLDMVVIAQSAPGPLAVNSAIIFGYRMAGLTGALLSALAIVLPPLVIISVICLIYDTFASNIIVQTALQVMRAGVAAIIIDVVIDLAGDVLKTKDLFNIFMMVLALIASYVYKISAIHIILLFIAIGIARSLRKRKGDIA